MPFPVNQCLLAATFVIAWSYPIKALIITGGSILTGYPNPDLWKRCLAKLDLLVCFDRFLTADSVLADYVLPAATCFEKLGYHRSSGYVQIRNRVIPPLGGARSNYWIFVALDDRLGYGHLYPRDEEALVDFALKKGQCQLPDRFRKPGSHLGISRLQSPVVRCS